MAKKRRLGDLYVKGKELTFDDGDGEPITVWVRKMTPVDHEAAMRGANAARSRVLSARRDPESDEYQSMWVEAEEFERDALIMYLVADERQDRQAVVEAEIGDEEEWSTDEYLQGLTDSWEESLSDAYVMDPEDPEALACFNELQRFAAVVNQRLDSADRKVEADLQELSDDALRQKVFVKVVEVRASIAWLTAYRRQEVLLGTREADRHTRYFQHAQEVAELPLEVFTTLSTIYRELTVDPTEGKGSEETPASSSSSEQHDEAGTEVSSGPTDVAA